LKIISDFQNLTLYLSHPWGYHITIKESRLLNLPPAARVALIRKTEGVFGLKIKFRYVFRSDDRDAVWLPVGHKWDGVPYERWLAHAGKIVRLWEWVGTGEGMIGGPAKRQAGVIWWGGAAEFPYKHSAEKCLETADELEAWLADDRYEFTDRNREEVLGAEEQAGMPISLSHQSILFMPPPGGFSKEHPPAPPEPLRGRACVEG
jgi:hypothetical protein